MKSLVRIKILRLNSELKGTRIFYFDYCRWCLYHLSSIRNLGQSDPQLRFEVVYDRHTNLYRQFTRLKVEGEKFLLCLMWKEHPRQILTSIISVSRTMYYLQVFHIENKNLYVPKLYSTFSEITNTCRWLGGI